MSISNPVPAAEGLHALPETERRVLLELLLYGGQSRVRVAERLGLSRTSLSRVTRTLLDGGWIAEGSTQLLGTRGRPAEELHLLPEAAHFVGVKLTGDRLYLVVTDLTATVVSEAAVDLPSSSVADVVALIAEETARAIASVGRTAGIGIAVAGDVTTSAQGRVLRHSNFLGWDDIPLDALVAHACGLPTTMVNDVHALAGGQHWFGGETKYRSLVVYGLGAGIGCGIVIDGELLPGVHGRAGRVGHSRVGGQGRRCTNGHYDCIHSFVTIPAIERNAHVPVGDYAVALQRAREGHPVAVRAFEEAARALGMAVADAVNAVDPDAVAIMGEGVDMLEIAPQTFRRALEDFLEQGDPDSVRIECPPFHFDLYARGAAVAAMRHLLA